MIYLFGGSYLFEEVTFRLGAGDRVGLVGKKVGKSTM
jgi:ATP-binding cassette subfamily F protein 3